MPPGMLKRWSGYALERFARDPNNLTEILSGSEGTLAAIFSAELKIVPLPREPHAQRQAVPPMSGMQSAGRSDSLRSST